MANAISARERAQKKKLQADMEELDRVEKQMVELKAEQVRKKEESRKQMLSTLAENAKNIAAKKEAQRLEAEKDEKMMQVLDSNGFGYLVNRMTLCTITQKGFIVALPSFQYNHYCAHLETCCP